MFVKLCDCASLCNVMIVKEKTKNGFFFYIYKDFFFLTAVLVGDGGGPVVET